PAGTASACSARRALPAPCAWCGRSCSGGRRRAGARSSHPPSGELGEIAIEADKAAVPAAVVLRPLVVILEADMGQDQLGLLALLGELDGDQRVGVGMARLAVLAQPVPSEGDAVIRLHF